MGGCIFSCSWQNLLQFASKGVMKIVHAIDPNRLAYIVDEHESLNSKPQYNSRKKDSYAFSWDW